MAEAGKDHHHHVRKVAFYDIPRQRQRWGDHQVHPHTNWADTFFDLFYVAAAYNLGNVLREDPTPTGLLYTAGLFFPIQNLWTFKMYYDSRFYNQNDYFHGVYEVAVLLALASSVLYIRPVAILSDPAGHPDMFRFSLSILIAYLLSLGRLVEIAVAQKVVKSQTGLFPESLSASLRDGFSLVLSVGFLLAATIYAGVQYRNGSSSVYVDKSIDAHRVLAEKPDSTTLVTSYESDNVPILLLLGSTLISFAAFITKMLFYSHANVDHKQISVPMNVDFAIHRYGEWTMLMLGETVLSLLIVDVVVTPGYFATFLGGVVSIVLLEYLHFQSQPSDPDKHAYRRSRWSGTIFYWLMQIYSMALIVLGASFKMLLYEEVYRKEKESRRNLFGGFVERFLAGSESAALRFSADDRQQRIAHFFSGSLAIVFLSMDVIQVSHRGVKANWERCSGNRCDRKKKRLSSAHIFCRVAVLVFTATLSQYFTSPDFLALLGLGTIVCQFCLRVFASVLFLHDTTEAEEEAIQRAIEYNSARIHKIPERIEDPASPSD